MRIARIDLFSSAQLNYTRNRPDQPILDTAGPEYNSYPPVRQSGLPPAPPNAEPSDSIRSIADSHAGGGTVARPFAHPRKIVVAENTHCHSHALCALGYFPDRAPGSTKLPAPRARSRSWSRLTRVYVLERPSNVAADR
jgi:hypothetical protein